MRVHALIDHVSLVHVIEPSPVPLSFEDRMERTVTFFLQRIHILLNQFFFA